eukprot:CAMPEP_0206159586 /NCGR_PEP_ID=MMETSP1474-20131121/5975_1 /ASSEMBLY_ACC=CAM_ASM_001110 /TAXON_ID=97495 /ORGANISM="Imantonia sp., Strain RCC918" /LENGTH=161 /DNA_ID=CAMNT_0053560397 /DNA_START=801 /DNA_END=1289 /DNA_ORIENTATION=-
MSGLPSPDADGAERLGEERVAHAAVHGTGDERDGEGRVQPIADQVGRRGVEEPGERAAVPVSIILVDHGDWQVMLASDTKFFGQAVAVFAHERAFVQVEDHMRRLLSLDPVDVDQEELAVSLLDGGESLVPDVVEAATGQRIDGEHQLLQKLPRQALPLRA